ncbi:MAG: NAD-dependent epimerase/dehydratase family protein [Chlamydiota bacterium]|nr:NAD-dependent epimerase/dehydratase family protein [Chlamydiota bacterium]
MKVLVTGGTGFTGSHLVRRLINRGHEVHVLDALQGLFLQELRDLGAKVIIGSVTDQDLLKKMTKDCEVVYHLAAAFRKINLPKKEYWNINVEGTRKLLETALWFGVKRFVYCSTQGVHGDIKNLPGDENSPIAPEDYYQYTKHEGEKVVLEYVEKGLAASIIRPTAIYGPGDPGRFLIIYRLVKGGQFLMFGNGKAYYHPVYIDNLVDSFELAAEKPEAIGQAYIIADEHYYTIEELVSAIGQAIGVDVKIRHLPFRPLWLAAVLTEGICTPLGLEPPLFRRRVDWFRQNRAFRIDKAKKELGYIPKIDLKTGLAETGKWYRENGYI